jgi:putative hemolysin
MDTMPPYLSLIIVIVCFLASFMFTAAENAFANCNIYHYKVLADDNNFTAKIIYKMASKFDNSLVTVLVGNNISQAILSNIAAIFFLMLSNAQNWPNGVESIVSTVIVSIFLYLFDDFLPKVISKNYPDMTLEIFIYPIFIFYILFYPIIIIFRFFLFIIKKASKNKAGLTITKEEFIDKADEANDKVLEDDEKKILSRAFNFDSISVKQVLTPKSKIYSLNIDTLTTKKLNKILLKVNYSRIPIYKTNKDNIVGILTIRTYFKAYMENNNLDIKSVLTKPIKVKEDDKVDDIFREFNDEKTHIALVYNKNKTFIGMITMDDVLEELVGDISEGQTTTFSVEEDK